MTTYVTEDGDMLDAICAKHYGIGKFDMQAVRWANVGLAAFGPVFPQGLTITLPESARITPQPKLIRLTD